VANRIAVIRIGQYDNAELVGGRNLYVSRVPGNAPAMSDSDLVAGPPDREAQSPAAAPIRAQPLHAVHLTQGRRFKNLVAAQRLIPQLKRNELRQILDVRGQVSRGADSIN